MKNKLTDTSRNSDEYRKIEGEIKEVDEKINQSVYQIYGLDEADIKTIEQSVVS